LPSFVVPYQQDQDEQWHCATVPLTSFQHRCKAAYHEQHGWLREAEFHLRTVSWMALSVDAGYCGLF
uniref:Myotubularin phosphatase domain-containing protein n=1 Tax=Haemonchus placei TaxID=6290 RepID=A0A0N4X9P2_HAEPC